MIAVLTNETHKPALVRLTEGAELLAPSSLPAELGNAFSAMFKRGRISLEHAKAAVGVFYRLPVRLVGIDLPQALELSDNLDLYAYDAYVIVCGLQQRAPILTLDAGQREAALRAGADVLEVKP